MIEVGTIFMLTFRPPSTSLTMGPTNPSVRLPFSADSNSTSVPENPIVASNPLSPLASEIVSGISTMDPGSATAPLRPPTMGAPKATSIVGLCFRSTPCACCRRPDLASSPGCGGLIGAWIAIRCIRIASWLVIAPSPVISPEANGQSVSSSSFVATLRAMNTSAVSTTLSPLRSPSMQPSSTHKLPSET